MRKIAYSLIALAMTAFTFTSCEDVPAPFGQPEDPGSGGGGTVVVEPKGSGTEADPYNVAAVKAKTETLADGESIKDVYTKGYICQIDEIDITGTYGNSTYWISDDAEGKSGKYEVYRGVGLGGQKFNEAGATIIKEGDLVIIKGTIKNFKGTTPEYDAGSILVELNGVPAGGGGDTPTETLGTKDAPLNIAQALELINALADKAESDKFAFVKGKVVKVTTNQANFDQYGNLNYLISEDGTENGSTITVYSGDGLNGAKFSGPGDLAQGDEVIVYGKLYKYVNNSGAVTPEINKGNYLVSLVKGSGGGGGGDTPSGETLGTKDSPLNVAQALELINALADKAESEKFAFVKGKVVKVTTNQTNFEKYGNLNYLISDDGTENSTITVYSGDGLNGAKFSGPGDLEPGDEVIVYGKLYKYVNNSGAVTPEINKGNYLVSLVKGSGGGGGGDTPGGDTPTSLTNGGFETWADGLPTGWKSASTASSATLEKSTDAHGGSYSVLVKGDEGNNKRLASQEIKLAAGTYVFSFYVKATVDPAQVRPGYVPVTEGKVGSYAYADYATVSAGSWTKVSHEFTLNAETTVCLVVMNPKKSSYSSGKDILIDDATLTKK